jgi:hypothetical protein
MHALILINAAIDKPVPLRDVARRVSIERVSERMMPLSTLDLDAAREVVEELLSKLKLEAFLFAVEHTARGWELRVECAAEDGWQTETILLGDELPGRSEADTDLRRRLMALLDERLTSCRRSG